MIVKTASLQTYIYNRYLQITITIFHRVLINDHLNDAGMNVHINTNYDLKINTEKLYKFIKISRQWHKHIEFVLHFFNVDLF